jgi:hypothetical protein
VGGVSDACLVGILTSSRGIPQGFVHVVAWVPVCLRIPHAGISHPVSSARRNACRPSSFKVFVIFVRFGGKKLDCVDKFRETSRCQISLNSVSGSRVVDVDRQF